uniref:Helicase SKI2W n=1 Tax=Lygus hesperus TaxID=30085 RepID=A0A0A9WLI5_LYGHE
MQEDEVKTFIQDRLHLHQKEGSVNFALDSQTNLPADDGSKRTTGSKMDFLLENADGVLDKRFRDTLSTLSPQFWSGTMLEKWQQRFENYMEDEEDDLSPDEWEDLEGSLRKFHNDVLKRFGENVGDGLHSTPSELYASQAIEAIKLLKTIKWKVSDAFDEIYFDDSETEVKRILNKVVDNAVLLVEGGRPFERADIHWVDPSKDQEFNKELYDFASANQVLPDAQQLPWLPPALQDATKLLPRDLLKRLTTPLKIGDVDDHEDWEFSATHPSHEEESFAQFEGPYEQLRKNLKDVLTAEIHNYSSKVDTTASIDPAIVEVAAKRLEAGEIDVDFKSMFILPYEANHCKLVGVRDNNVGNMITYKEVLKPPSERIVDQKLRNDPSAWIDPERPAGPRVRTFGWEPLADLEEDLPPDETEIIKKKENPDAIAAGSELNAIARERAEILVQTLKEKCSQVINEKNFISDSTANPSIKDYLKRKGQRFGIVPESFESPEDFLDALDIPIIREKDAGKAFSLDNEVIPLQSDWLGLDGTGPHEQLTEELYWKQLQSFKKPLSVPSVDWKALLDVPDNDDDGADTAELRRYLAEATEPHLKKEEAAPPEPKDSSNVEKDTPARKRALDKEFLKEWIDKFGDDEGIQGLDPKNFKPPEHLVSSEEYDEKFLTHPYTSSYVFHPNFVRFRRMTRNNPTYSEYTFKKLESASTLNFEDNAKEFKSILSNLATNGPEISLNDIQQLNEKNLGVEPEEAKKWDLEFSTYMTEGLTLLESFAATSRSAFSRPDKPCKEETSSDLLFGEVEKHELPEFLKDFRLQPFTLEDFGNIPNVGSGNNAGNEKKLKESKTSSQTEDSDSESEESDEEEQVIHEDVLWRPFKQFNGYKHTNVLQLLSDASQLIDTEAPKHVHPSPKILDWIQGKYQPSTNKLKKWRKLYGLSFPKVESSLKTPYLFLSEEERLNMLKKPDTEELHDPDNPWSLTEEEKIRLKNPAKKVDDTEEVQEDAGDEKVARLEELSGISVRLHRSTSEWAEELDTSEAPDMSVLGTPAMEFMFTLDNFQKQAIMALEKGYNVFVSAHTSAGKTVVAEYAIAMSRKRRSRAIYTSPIKALSNQKYKDFKKCFESVGLITGDVQLNETADCLIMTTEILRSMLYNASEGIRDLEFVVLDEVHYMNDRERGHVWEEVLILLPANVQIVMLSATVPNTMEFASWVGRNKERKVMVCKTLHRPVPLKHYFYVDLGKDPAQGQFLLRDGDGPVLKHEWGEIRRLIEEVSKEEKKAAFKKMDEKRALEAKRNKLKNHQNFEDQTKSFGAGPNKQEMMKFYNKKETAQWSKFIKYLQDIKWLPTIVFAFSRKKCDSLAELLGSIDLTTPVEKLCIKAFIKSQVAKLDEEDRNLPQIRTLGSHLVRGIGVHHSGILPVLKEIVEFLFQEGKVKLLFATETFAMGVNMPARTVVFYSIKKFDGGEQRFLLPAEYIQMAGRAGRRGEDTVGNVIIRCPTRDAQELSIETIESMMTGAPRTLTSQFRVSYRMILGTLTARSHITAENMMKQSYHENNEQKKYFQLEDALRIAKDLENKQRTLIHSRYKKDYIDRFCQIYNNIDECLKMWSKLREAESETPKFLKEVQLGKLVKFRCGPVASAIGVIMNITTKPLEYMVMGLRNFDRNGILELHPEMHESTRWFKFLSMVPLPKQKYSGGELDMRLVFYKIKVDDILEIYKDNVNVTSENSAFLIRNAQNANIGGRTKCDAELEHICYKLHSPTGLKPVDEVSLAKESDFELYQFMKIKEEEVADSLAEFYSEQPREDFIEAFAKIFKWMETVKGKDQLQKEVAEKTMTLYPEYANKMEILKTMNYVVEDSVQMKGYMAARISKYELVITEMLVRNVIKDLTPEEVAGLMSFIVYQARAPSAQKDDSAEEIPIAHGLPNLQKAIENTKIIIEEIIDEEKDRNVISEELEDLRKDPFKLTDIMYQWAKQKSFSKVIRMAKDFQEGMLVRWIQQLVEALKEIESAARVMGDPAVPEKIQASIKTIKRGIVFSPSLYTTL